MTTESMMRRWREWHAEQLELALDGDNGTIVKNIMILVRGLRPERMPTLLRLMRSIDWRTVNADAKFTILHELNGAIARLREGEGRVPFDDSLLDEEPTLFQTIREMLR
jgi:hypothetical protein